VLELGGEHTEVIDALKGKRLEGDNTGKTEKGRLRGTKRK